MLVSGPNPASDVRQFMLETKRAIDALASVKLGASTSPTFSGLTLSGLTATRLVSTDSSKGLTSTDLASWVTGTASEIDVTDDGDGTITIGIADPLSVTKGGTGAATFTDHSLLAGSGAGAITALGAATNGQLPIGSTGADPTLATLTGTANQITVTNGAGSITLSTPQDIATTSDVEFQSLLVDQDTDATALEIDSEATTAGNYGLKCVTGQGAIAALFSNGAVANGSFYAACPNNAAYSGSFVFARDLAAASTDGSVVYIHQDNAGDDQPCLELQQDGTGYALLTNGDIRCDGSMTVTGSTTYDGNITIPDNGYIGSASDNDAIQIEADGDVVFSQRVFLSGDMEISGNIIVTDDAGIGVADNLPLIVFDDTDGQVEITGDLTISGIATASRLLSADAHKKLVSTDLASWVTGTANRVTVTDDSDGTITLSGPQDVHTGASPTFAGLTLTGLSGVLKAAAGIVAGSADHADLLNIGSSDHHNPVTLGTANGLSLSTQELSLPTSATPQFARLGLGDSADATAVLYTKSSSYPVVLEERTAGAATTGFWSVHDFTVSTTGAPSTNDMAVGILFNINGSGGDYNLGRIGCQQGDNAGEYGQLLFRTANNGTPSQWMILKQNGYLGIGGSFTSPQARLDVYGDARFGDSTTNYAKFDTNGDLTFQGTAGFYPVRLSQSAQPTPDTGELVVWRDTDDSKTYLVYNDTDEGVRKVEMT